MFRLVVALACLLAGPAYAQALYQPAENVLFSSTAATTLANSTAETSLLPAGAGTLTLPANFWTVGRQIRVKGRGFYSSSALSPTVTVRSKFNGTTLATATANALLNNASNQGFSFEELATCRSVGTSGTVQIDGALSFQASNGLVGGAYLVDVTPSTVDTTVTQTFGFTGTWSAASASNSVTVTQVTVEVLN